MAIPAKQREKKGGHNKNNPPPKKKNENRAPPPRPIRGCFRAQRPPYRRWPGAGPPLGAPGPVENGQEPPIVGT